MEPGEIELREGEGDGLPILGHQLIGLTASDVEAVVLIDASKRDDVQRLLYRHARVGAEGQCTSRWARRAHQSDTEIALILQFDGRDQMTAILEFNAATDGLLLDHVMKRGRLVLVSGKKGRPVEALQAGEPNMAIEVTTIPDEWERLWTEALCRKRNCSPDEARALQQALRSKVEPQPG